MGLRDAGGEMILVELALQRTRGFAGTVRLPFRPGLNVLKLEHPEQRSAVLDCVYHPLFPDPTRSSATAHLAEDDEARAVLSFYGRDKVAYRLMRTLATGATRLYRFDQQAKRYHLLSEASQEAAQYVRVQQQLPDEVSFERFFLMGPGTVPSAGVQAPTRSGTPILKMGTADLQFGGPTPDPSGFGAQGSYAGFGQGVGSYPGFGPPGVGPGTGGGVGIPGAAGLGMGAPPRAMSTPGAVPGGAMGFNPTNALVLAEMEGSSDASAAPDRKEDLLAERKRLLAHLTAASKAEKAQSELDELMVRRSELAHRVERLQQLRQDRDAFREQALTSQDLEDLPPGLRKRLKTFEEAEQRFEAEKLRLVEEKQSLESQRQERSPGPLQQDPYLMGGAGVALLSWVLAVALGQPWIALLNVAGLVVAASAAFRHIGDLEEMEAIDERVQQTEEREEKLNKQHELDTSVIRKLMTALQVDNPAELAERLDGYEKLKQQTAAAEEAVEQAEADPEVRNADQELARIEPRIKELENQVMGAAGTHQSSEQLTRRIAAIDGELEQMGVNVGPSVVKVVRGTEDLPPLALDEDDDEEDGYGSGSYSGSGRFDPSTGGHTLAPGLLAAPGGFGGGGLGGLSGPPGYPGGGGMPGAPPAAPDRSRELMHMGADMLQVDVEGLVASLTPRLRQYLSALTEGAVVEGVFGPRGELSVRTQKLAVVPYMQLPPAELDVVDLALRLALVEAVVSKHRIPMVFEDPILSMPPGRRKMFLQMIQYLSRLTQVVCVTGGDDVEGQPVAIGRT